MGWIRSGDTLCGLVIHIQRTTVGKLWQVLLPILIMSDFANKYTTANIAQDAAQYEPALFLRLHEKLTKLVPSECLAPAIIVHQRPN